MYNEPEIPRRVFHDERQLRCRFADPALPQAAFHAAGGALLKKIILFFVTIGALATPLMARAEGVTVFADGSIGFGGSYYSGQYSGAYGLDSHGNPYYGAFSNLTGSSFNLVAGANVYWTMNSAHSLWMGVGTTISLPITYGSNNTNGAVGPSTLSLDVPFLYDISRRLSIAAKPSLLGVMLFDGLSADTLYGVGFGISAGPVFYLDDRALYGISILAGYKYLSAQGDNYYWGNETYSGSSLYVTACFTYVWASNNAVPAETTSN